MVARVGRCAACQGEELRRTVKGHEQLIVSQFQLDFNCRVCYFVTDVTE